MGGNAGTQTMTVAVRALATRELNPTNVVRVVVRETAVGLINGIAFALIMALVVFLWFGTEQLGLVIGAAMIVNMLAAALAGIFIPLALDRMGFDPGGCVNGVRDDGDRRGRILLVPRARHAVAQVRQA